MRLNNTFDILHQILSIHWQLLDIPGQREAVKRPQTLHAQQTRITNYG